MKVNQVQTPQETVPPPAEATFEPSKPLIPRMIKLHVSLGKTGDMASHNLIDRLERERDSLRVWTAKEMEHLSHIGNRTWLEQGWSAVKAVADCIVSVVSFAMGGYFLATGNTSAGNFLIASGVFNILQTVFARQGMWDWISETLAEKNEAARDKLKVAFPIIVSLLGLGFSIAGARLNMAPGTLLEHLETAKMYMATGGQVVDSTFKIQKGFDDARIPEIQGGLKKHEQASDLTARLLEYCMKETRRIKSTIKKPINALMQATTLASTKV